MTIKRKLPRSDDAIEMTITKAKNKLKNCIASEITLTQATQLKLAALTIDWAASNSNLTKATFNKTTATANAEAQKLKASIFIRHFIQCFNMGVDRNIYTKQERAFFHLPVNSDKLPYVGSIDNIKLWGDRIVSGDARRIAAGGKPMSNPTAAEVEIELDEFVRVDNIKTNKVAAFAKIVIEIIKLRIDAKKVVKKIFDESETFYNHLSPRQMRDRCRGWGIIYTSSEVITIIIDIIDIDTNLAIEGASLYFSEGNTTSLSNHFGTITIKTTVADMVTFIIKAENYETITTEFNFDNAIFDYDITIKMIPDKPVKSEADKETLPPLHTEIKTD